MGFLDDLLEIGKEFNALRDEVVQGVADTIGSVVDPIQDARSAINESAKSLMGEATSAPALPEEAPKEPASSSTPFEG